MSWFSSKFAILLMLGAAVPAVAASSATISGVVQDSGNTPLMGAVVELLGANPIPILTAFTDIHGRYRFAHVAPGHYRVQVLQAYFLPAARNNLLIAHHAHAIVNLTLMSLFDAAQWLPAQPRSPGEPTDDWKWTLRSAADRPVLRWTSDPDNSNNPNNHPNSDRRIGGMDRSGTRNGESSPSRHRTSMRLAVNSGSSQFGQGGIQEQGLMRVADGAGRETIVRFQTSSEGAAMLAGGIERDPAPGDVLRTLASYRTLPVSFGRGASELQILELRGGQQLTLSDALLAQFGAATEAVQAGQTVTAAFPFLAVKMHASGNQVAYRMATAANLQDLADMSPTPAVPQMSMRDGRLRLTRSLHQEVALDRKLAGMQMEAAYYYDHLVDPVLNGYGDVNAAEFASGDVLLDPATGAFRSAGPNYSGGGFRVFATRQVKDNLWTTVEYAEGPAIMLPVDHLMQHGTYAEALAGAESGRTQSVLFSMHGHIIGTGTRWKAAYRWQPEASITAVDPFRTGMANPFLSLLIRQPVRCPNLAPDKLELEFEMANVLAQGYRPIYSTDGQTLYFAQAPRLMTGGLAFSF